MMNEHTWSQNINTSQQPAVPTNKPSTAPVPITVPVTVTFPSAEALTPAKTQEMNIVRVLAIIAGVFFLVGSGLFLISHIIE
ncbi:hypothetical protein [Neobacillus bataviensis]|uniref:hypothetical protein n=1 Tax=Neobacillus bataviensis TaxID=220685 RepID=UPI001CBE7048|nr:hypothetical protein [Neobacillus bataviensis]